MRRAPLFLVPAALATVALVGAGSLMADQVVNVRRRTHYAHRVVSVSESEVTLGRDRGTQRVGTYGLAFPGGHAVIGEVSGGTDSTVVRPIVRVDSGTVVPGPASLDHVDVGDPRSAFGLDFEEVRLQSDVGELPAWVLPAPAETWVVMVHGYGGKRASALSFLPMLRELGVGIVVPSYRNDPDAPASPDVRYHLGATEWRDVDAAIGHAIDRGAERIVLFGWSMGGAIALQVFSRSEHRKQVVALVLDSPVLDWRAVLRHVSRRRRIPGLLTRYATRLIERRVAIDFDEFDWVARSSELDVATLVVHGDDDETVPHEPSVEMARRRGDTVELRLVAGAGHVGSFNVDPEGYAAAIAALFERVRASSGA